MTDQRIVDALEAAGVDYDKEGFDQNRLFKDNGVDSLDVMSLFLALEEAYGVKFSEQDVSMIATPRELAEALNRKL